MCGIFAYASSARGKSNASEEVFKGLEKLDYRGYDSWGIAQFYGGGLKVNKEVGILDASKLILSGGKIALGHTRWATHGGVTQKNAHPHYSIDEKFVLVHNGVVENFKQLKTKLEKKGFEFVSETDSEVIVHLISHYEDETYDFVSAVKRAFLELAGRNTIALLRNDGTIIGIRNGSPLVLATDIASETHILSSDTNSLVGVAEKYSIIDDFSLVEINSGDFYVQNIKTRELINPKFTKLNIQAYARDKGNYEHYMLKEIHETSGALRALCEIPNKSFEELAHDIRKSKCVYSVGSGSSAAAAAQIAYYLRDIANINAISLIGADCDEYMKLLSKEDLLIAPSQSGETADVLKIMEIAKKKGVKIASLVNMQGSMMTRLSDYKFMCNSGIEVCVMTTKVLSAQMAWGYLLAKSVVYELDAARDEILSLATTIDSYLHDLKALKSIKNAARLLASHEDIYLLGKADNYQIIKEGMIKIIEGTYVHAHALPAGDLKHYCITLMEKGVQVLTAVTNSKYKQDIYNALSEVSARGATTIGIASKNNFDHWIQVPDVKELSSLMVLVALQLLSYYMALELGHSIDKPRNIAKSVTVL